MVKFGGITREQLMFYDNIALEEVEKLCENKLKELQQTDLTQDVEHLKERKAEFEEIKEFLELVNKEIEKRRAEQDRYMPTGETPTEKLSTRQVIECLANSERQMKSLLINQFGARKSQVVEFLKNKVTEEKVEMLKREGLEKPRKSYKMNEYSPERDLAEHMKDSIRFSSELFKRLRELPEEDRSRLLTAIKERFGRFIAIENIEAEFKRQEEFKILMSSPNPDFGSQPE